MWSICFVLCLTETLAVVNAAGDLGMDTAYASKVAFLGKTKKTTTINGGSIVVKKPQK